MYNNDKKETLGEKISNFWYDYGACTLITLGTLGLLAGVTVPVGVVLNRNVEIRNLKLQIEKNVVEYNDIAKFTGSAYTVTKSSDQYFVDLFGTSVKTPNATPAFTSLTYSINKDTYDEAFKYADIVYEYGRDGQVVGAENVYRNDLQFFGGMWKAHKAQESILHDIEKATQGPAYLMNEIGKTNQEASQRNQKQGIVNMTRPVMNKEENTAAFFVTTYDAKNPNAVKFNNYEVSQELSPEMLNNMGKVYEGYLNKAVKGKLVSSAVLPTELTSDSGLTK